MLLLSRNGGHIKEQGKLLEKLIYFFFMYFSMFLISHFFYFCHLISNFSFAFNIILIIISYMLLFYETVYFSKHVHLFYFILFNYFIYYCILFLYYLHRFVTNFSFEFIRLYLCLWFSWIRLFIQSMTIIQEYYKTYRNKNM